MPTVSRMEAPGLTQGTGSSAWTEKARNRPAAKARMRRMERPPGKRWRREFIAASLPSLTIYAYSAISIPATPAFPEVHEGRQGKERSGAPGEEVSQDQGDDRDDREYEIPIHPT